MHQQGTSDDKGELGAVKHFEGLDLRSESAPVIGPSSIWGDRGFQLRAISSAEHVIRAAHDTALLDLAGQAQQQQQHPPMPQAVQPTADHAAARDPAPVQQCLSTAPSKQQAAGMQQALPNPCTTAAPPSAPEPFARQAAEAPFDPFAQQAAQPPLDPFAQQAAQQAAAQLLLRPSPVPPAAAQTRTSELEFDFAADHGAFGAVVFAGGVAINTCTLGPQGDCAMDVGVMAHGSFGTVHLGFYFDEPVVVKLLAVQLGESDAAVRARILREVELQARAANHGGIVRFVAVCFDPPAIVMEKCDCSLAHRIQNHWARQPQTLQPQLLQPQPEPEPTWRLVVQLMRHAAGALSFLHRPGQAIFHNDIRAANMVLSRTFDGGGVGWRLKLCDFGLAAFSGDAAAGAQVPEVTHENWRAPEVSYNTETARYTVTAAADVYALGCVLHEMMVLGLPAQQFPADMQRLPGLQGSPPQGLQALFEACVSHTPAHRPDALRVVQALRVMAPV